jgi:hypothetical protein
VALEDTDWIESYTSQIDKSDVSPYAPSEMRWFKEFYTDYDAAT